MHSMIRILFVLITFVFFKEAPLLAQELIKDNNNGMIVRISEIEVFPEYLEEYLTYAKEVAEQSVKNEQDVISIYPMSEIKDNTQIRILEIYRNSKAYKDHIASSHFQKYKKATLHMVKSLNLVDTYQLCPDNFERIFVRAK